MKKWLWVVALLTFFLFALSMGFSQESKPKMRQEIVKLKYIDKSEILNVLYTFVSRDGRISPSPQAGLITISDYSENVEKIMAVIRELDVKPADLLFTIQLVLGSQSGEEATDAALRDDPTIRELSTLLKFKSFSLLDTSLVRAIDREDSQVTMGKNAELRLDLRPIYIKDENEDRIQVETRLQKMGALVATGENTRREWTSLVSSNFSMKSGEKTVVGVSKMDGGDKALILIISGKVID